MKVLKIFFVIAVIVMIAKCVSCNNKDDKKSTSSSIELEASRFYPPTKSPFKHNVGLNFNVEMTNWFNNPAIKYSAALKNQCTYGRLANISKQFKLIRIYSYLIAGWEQTGNISPEAYALSTLAKKDKNIEAVIGTSCNRAWYLVPANVQTFIDTLQSNFGSSISQVKCILIGNEINANSYTSGEISVIMSNFRTALATNCLNIPVSVTFNNLPNQAGDTLSDNLVGAVVNGWDTTWNGNKPFVFIDPYPDAAGINNAAGVYAWQYGVTKYYQTLHPSLQIFIGETGAEGSSSDYTTTVVIDSVFSQLNLQYKKIRKTVPTFLFEAINEPLKPSSPNQQFMGLYFDSSDPKKFDVHLKSNINLPTWLNK
jgi:hypothetical protein